MAEEQIEEQLEEQIEVETETAKEPLPLVDRVAATIQSGYPIAHDPYGVLAETLDVAPIEVAEAVETLYDTNVIRRMGASFDPHKLGYVTSLCALNVMDAQRQLGRSITEVNKHPQVTHNYSRVGKFNLWFTVSTRTVEERKEVLQKIRKQVFTPGIIDAPAVKKYKVCVDFGAQEGTAPVPAQPEVAVAPGEPFSADNAFDVEVVRWAQEDIARDADGCVVTQPYQLGARKLSEKLGREVTEEELTRRLLQFKAQGVIRRFGAMVRHQNLGYTHNTLAAFKVAPESIDVAGEALAALPFVSHCYQRVPNPMFDMNLYAMVHAKSEEEMTEYLAALRQALADAGAEFSSSASMPTIREHKKQSARYFVEGE